MQSSTNTVPWFIRRFTTKFEWRHLKGVTVARSFAAVWLVILGSILCSYRYWWGVTLFLAAGLLGWFAYHGPQWKRALEAEKDAVDRL